VYSSRDKDKLGGKVGDYVIYVIDVTS